MMAGHLDPLERLRRSNPVPHPDPSEADTPRARALMERVMAASLEEGVSSWSPPHRRRRTFWILLPAALICLAAGYAILSNVLAPLHVTCFMEPGIDQGDAVVLPADEADPVGQCAEVWRSPDYFGAQEVPPLVACVLSDGSVGVFPGDEGTCAAIGMEQVQGDRTEHGPVLELRDTLVDSFGSRSCVPFDEAQALVNDAFEQAGVEGWTVRPSAPFTDEEPCATLAFDEASRTVLLVPAEDYAD